MTSSRQQRSADVEIVEMDTELQSNNNATENVRAKTTTSLDTRMFDTAVMYIKPNWGCSKIKFVRMVNVLVADSRKRKCGTRRFYVKKAEYTKDQEQ